MKRDQKGFGAIEALLFLILASILGVTGYYVYHTRNNTTKTYNAASKDSSVNSNKATDVYAGWKSYDDDFVSLKYPSGWTVARDDNANLPGTKELGLTGPDDKAVAASTEVTAGYKAALVLKIFSNTDSSESPCSCKVYDLMPLAMAQLPKAQLAVSSDTSVGGDPTTPAQDLTVVDGSKVKLGVTSFNSYVYPIKNGVGIWAGLGGIRITDVSAFENTQSVTDLVKILNSANFK